MRVLACIAFGELKRFTGSSGELLWGSGMKGWGYKVESVRGGLFSPFCHNWKRQWARTSVGGFWAELLSVGVPLWNKGKQERTGWPIFHLLLPAPTPLPPRYTLSLAARHALLIEIKISLRQFVVSQVWVWMSETWIYYEVDPYFTLSFLGEIYGFINHRHLPHCQLPFHVFNTTLHFSLMYFRYTFSNFCQGIYF